LESWGNDVTEEIKESMKLKFLPTAQRFPIQMAYFIILTAYVATP
jgi:hypothetical protein